jgi:hypothetical protein
MALMKEKEALALLWQEIASPEGFLARLQRGDGIDHAGVERVQQALASLGQAWFERECLPIAGVLALMALDDTIFACRDQYPEEPDQRAIEDLGMAMYEVVLETLAPTNSTPDPIVDALYEAALADSDYWRRWCAETVVPTSPLNEREALDILTFHVAGPGLLFALRSELAARNRACAEKALNLTYLALDTLAPTWRRSNCVPRRIAMGLTEIRYCALAGWTQYQNWPGADAAHQTLRQIYDDLPVYVRQHLQPPAMP